MIESLSHFSIENAVEYGEVNDESGNRIDFAFDSYFARIRMTVKAWARAGTKNFLVFFITPLRAPVTMRCGKRDAPCQIGGWHAGKVLPATGYPLPAAGFSIETFGCWALGGNPRLSFFDRLSHVVRGVRIQISIRKNVLGLGILLTCFVTEQQS